MIYEFKLKFNSSDCYFRFFCPLWLCYQMEVYVLKPEIERYVSPPEPIQYQENVRFILKVTFVDIPLSALKLWLNMRVFQSFIAPVYLTETLIKGASQAWSNLPMLTRKQLLRLQTKNKFLRASFCHTSKFQFSREN